MIYLVEDDANIRELVTYTLCSTGLTTAGFAVPSAFWQALENEQPELILLDIMLPEEDGLSILSRLKQCPATAAIPVILLTAKGTEMDKVRGLELGADDYLPKPFGMMELVARVKARLRTAQTRPTEYRIGDLCVCPAQRTVTVAQQPVTLTLKEFEVLCYLLENRPMVLTRNQILDRVWGYEFGGESRTLDVHIRTLRQKLGVAGALICTVRGVGYRVTEEPS